MAKLSTQDRKNLPASDFVFPDSRKFPIHDRAHAIDALARSTGKPEEAEVRAAVKRRFPNIKIRKTLAKMQAAAAGSTDLDLRVPLWKDTARQIVYGVVLTPGLIDSQGDIASPEEIEKAAHQFLVHYRKHDVQHDERLAKIETVESFIAPDDMTIAGQQVLKGSWVMGVHVSDPEVWDRVEKGEVGGFSIGGSAIRIPLAA